MENQFEIKSLRERILLMELLDTLPNIDQIKYTPTSGTSQYDATWIQWNQQHKAAMRVICEVKVRNYPMTAYAGWLIEKDKYDYLMSQDYEKKLYINIHPDGIQCWNLSTCDEPTWKETILPINNQDNSEKNKINGDLMSSQSEKITREINIFEALDKAKDVYNKRTQK